MQVAHQQSIWTSGMPSAEEGTVSHAVTSDTNDGFFNRPVKIATFAWNVNDPFFHTFNPWAAFCEDPRNINRLAHFKNLRMTLCVQAVVNGNPFYYGRAVMSYIPLPNVDDYSVVASGDIFGLVQASQRPHIYLDPCKSEGGEIECPFIFPKTYMDIPTSEWNKMGQIVIQDVNPLYHANEQGDSVDVTIFAYAKNVSLNTPTCQVPDSLVPQGNDEYGRISYPAHLVANWAGRLANAPVIGAYARATEMIANATAGVASMFGYSRPLVPAEDVCTIRNIVPHSTTNERDDVVTLAVDAKREVTIDPRVCGLGPQDEMALVPLAQRESYFNQFVWTTDNVPDQHLFSVRVSPMLGISKIIGNTQYAMTPAAFVAYPFRYWKGSTIIRAQVVCSAYHRGRLRVVWDPDHCNDNCAEMFNTNYSMLLDITESQDITFKIGWGANTDYLEVPPIEHISSSVQIANFVNNAFGCNGTLSFYVVNGLTCPGSISTPVNVNLFTCMAEDFEVAVPRSLALDSVEADSSVGPIPPPTDGPGSQPAPPEVNDLIVAKRHFAFGSIYDPTPDITDMRSTIYDNRIQELWVYPGTHAFNVPAWGGGTTNVTSGDFIFEFRNHQALAKDISITIGGNTATGTLPPSIGGTVTITVPNVTLVAGYQDIAASIEVANTGRVLLSHVTSYFPQSYSRVFMQASDILPFIDEQTAGINPIGSYSSVQDALQGPLTFNVPSNHAPGTRGYFSSRYGMNLNGIDNPVDGALDINNHTYLSAPVATGPVWALTQGTSTNWVGEFVFGAYFIDTTLPAPQGAFQRFIEGKGNASDGFAEFLLELARAELEDLDDNRENVVPDELVPQGGCLRKHVDLGRRSDAHEVNSFSHELADVEFYLSESSEDDIIKPQGDDDTPEERNDDKDDANAPQHETVDLSMGPSSDVPGLPQIYFGEQITSWRQMLKRYHLKFRVTNASFSTVRVDINTPPNLPYGAAPSVLPLSSRVHLLDYVSHAYVCMRGSTKYRIMTTARHDLAKYWFNRTNYVVSAPTNASQGESGEQFIAPFSGGHVTTGLLNNCPGIEAPWYSQYRFYPGRCKDEETVGEYHERDRIRIFIQNSVPNGDAFVLMATGEDFSLSGFLSVPIFTPIS